MCEPQTFRDAWFAGFVIPFEHVKQAEVNLENTNECRVTELRLFRLVYLKRGIAESFLD
jgi:hypothetical protein